MFIQEHNSFANARMLQGFRRNIGEKFEFLEKFSAQIQTGQGAIGQGREPIGEGTHHSIFNEHLIQIVFRNIFYNFAQHFELMYRCLSITFSCSEKIRSNFKYSFRVI